MSCSVSPSLVPSRRSRSVLLSFLLTLLVLLLQSVQPSRAFRPALQQTARSPSTVVWTPASGIAAIPTGRSRVVGLVRTSSLADSTDPWDGDDIRWSSKIRRRILRSSASSGGIPRVLRSLMALNVAAYICQTLSTLHLHISSHPGAGPFELLHVAVKGIMGSLTIQSPFVKKHIFVSVLAETQPYRFLTSGFLHAGPLHLFFNMRSLARIPRWIETGLGPLLLLTAYVTAIFTGNVAFLMTAGSSPVPQFCLGASGGICGLYGLMFAALVRMKRKSAASAVLRSIAELLLVGLFVQGVSNSGHLGGFIGGALVGFLSGPRYEKSYALTRKNSLGHDPYDREYRQWMGFGVMPTRKGTVPLPVLCALLMGGIWLWLR